MKIEELNQMRKDITALIDDIKYHSDSLSDLDRLPVIQLKVILAKIGKLNQSTTILLHYIEKEQKATFTKLVEEKPEPIEEQSVPEPQPESKLPEVMESLKNEKKQNVDDRLKKLKVEDLMTAIGINEKYLYASELFGGDIGVFSLVVRQMNEMNDVEAVQQKLKEISGQYVWDAENKYVIAFKELVERKFDLS